MIHIILKAKNLEFRPYVPTTILSLLGLISGYLYYSLKNKDDNKIRELKTLPPEHRFVAIQMTLNDLGIKLDTEGMNSVEKLSAIHKVLTSRTRKYIIISITLIVLSLIAAFLVYDDAHSNSQKSKSDTDMSPSKNETTVYGNYSEGDNVEGNKYVNSNANTDTPHKGTKK